ncbi:MAG: GDSL-type esterase/lipase family protein [Anaerolineales bacterium]
MKKIILFVFLFLVACSPAYQPATEIPIAETMIMPTAEQATPQAEVPTSVIESPLSTLPPGPLTLVALGDSLTQGDGDDSGQGGYTGRLLNKINQVRPESTLLNLGQSGWSSDALINGDQGIASQLDRAVVELQNAIAQGRGAVALVWIGSNDLWYLYEYGGDVTDEGDTQDTLRFSSNMDLILSRLRGTGATVLVALLDDQSQRPVALKGEAFTSITPDELQRMSVQVQRYNEIISEKVAQYQAETVDFYHTDIFTNPATLYDDGNHPNQAGYDIIAQMWFEAMSKLLN